MNHQPGAAKELLASTLGDDPFERIEELRKLGARKAKAEGRAYHMEHMRKVVLSHVMNRIAAVHASEKLSEAKLDRLARADDTYREHIEGAAAAVEDRELAVAEYYAKRGELLWLEKAVAHVNAVSKLSEPVG